MGKTWEDFAVGLQFRTPAITVTEAHLVTWAGLTMDFYPLHVDREYAAQTQFGERIAHGPLTFALAVGLVGLSRVAEESVVAWLGVDAMEIPAPVRIGDTIHVEAEVTEQRALKDPRRGLTVMRYNVVNQEGRMVMTFLMRFLMHTAHARS